MEGTDRREIRTRLINSHLDMEILIEKQEGHHSEAEWEMQEHRSEAVRETLETAHSEAEREIPEGCLAAVQEITMDSLDTMGGDR